MNHMFTVWATRFGVLAAAAALAVGSAPGASAQGGTSQPGVTVTAQNPGTSPHGSNLRITLTAHTEKSTVATPDCRPTAPTMRCWGALVLRIPAAGGLSVTGLQAHRVAVGDITCGDDEGSCGGDGDSCGDEGGDCGGGGVAAAAAVGVNQPVRVQVNGLGVLTNPGAIKYPGVTAGTQVQLKITLTDNGPAPYKDTVDDIQINLFQPGSNKPLLYRDATPQTIQQVRIHFKGNAKGHVG